LDLRPCEFYSQVGIFCEFVSLNGVFPLIVNFLLATGSATHDRVRAVRHDKVTGLIGRMISERSDVKRFARTARHSVRWFLDLAEQMLENQQDDSISVWTYFASFHRFFPWDPRPDGLRLRRETAGSGFRGSPGEAPGRNKTGRTRESRGKADQEHQGSLDSLRAEGSGFGSYEACIVAQKDALTGSPRRVIGYCRFQAGDRVD